MYSVLSYSVSFMPAYNNTWEQKEQQYNETIKKKKEKKCS